MSAQTKMNLKGHMEKAVIYTTWYEFRQELGKKLGRIPLNWLWFEVKPECPLPWDESDLQTSFFKAIRLVNQKSGLKI